MNRTIYFIYLFLTLILTSCAGLDDQENKKNKQADLYYSQGTQELVDKNYTASLKLLLKAKALKPHDSKILNNLGMSYYFKNRPDLALEYINKALTSNPENWDARNNLASIYFQKGDFQKASQEYLKIKNALTYEHQYRVLFNLGLIEIKKGHNKIARDYFEMSIKEKEDYCPAQFQLGIQDFKNRNYKKAKERFHLSTLGTCYQWPAATYYQGLSLWKLHDHDNAKAKFQDVLTRFPETRYGSLAREKLERLQVETEFKE